MAIDDNHNTSLYYENTDSDEDSPHIEDISNNTPGTDSTINFIIYTVFIDIPMYAFLFLCRLEPTI